MNQVQQTYTLAKAAYEAAITNKDWEAADALEDKYLDAEVNLVEWAIAKTEETKMLADEEIMTLKRFWTLPQYCEKIIDLALMLNA